MYPNLRNIQFKDPLTQFGNVIFFLLKQIPCGKKRKVSQLEENTLKIKIK